MNDDLMMYANPGSDAIKASEMTLKQYHESLSEDQNITMLTIDAFITKNNINQF